MRSRPPTACCAPARYKRALVIGAETFSRILDWTDRTTCVLFGDGAGAVVLEAQQQPGTREDRGVLTAHLRSDGRHKQKLYVDGGPSSTGTVGHLRMEGREVFKHAVGDDHRRDRGRLRGDRLHRRTTSTGSCRTRPTSASSTPRAHKLGIAPEKVVITVDRHGNTSAASIPLALDVAVQGRPHQEGRPGAARGDGRRLHLGRGAGPLVRRSHANVAHQRGR